MGGSSGARGTVATSGAPPYDSAVSLTRASKTPEVVTGGAPVHSTASTASTATSANLPGLVRELQQRAGNRATARLLAIGQAKLAVSPAGDRYEREADDVAREVMRALRHGSGEGSGEAATERLRSAGGEGAAPLGGRIARLPGTAAAPIGPEGGDVDHSVETRIRAAGQGGSRIPAGVRRPMEGAFGADFGDVRLHRGNEAEALNRDVGALAFTVGNDIFLGKSAPEVTTPAGQSVLAHELTHTIQQGAARLFEKADGAEVQRIAAIGAAPLSVQRHGSAEHLMLGQVNPKDLKVIADAREGAKLVRKEGGDPVAAKESAMHVLLRERGRVRAWQRNEPKGLDDVVDPEWQVRLVRVTPTSQLEEGSTRKDVICTYGEMNMLADYFGSPEELKALHPDRLWRVLQTEREGYYLYLGNLLKEFASEAFVEKDVPVKGWFGTSWGAKTSRQRFYLPESKWELESPKESDYTETAPGTLEGQAFEGSARYHKGGETGSAKLNAATMEGLEGLPGPLTDKGILPQDPGLQNFYGKGKGTGTAWGVTARNACHFAPESWRSWEKYHREALSLADRADRMRFSARSPGNSKEERSAQMAKAEELENEAWLTNGFGDHYLQDSFAAGHLVNKTLIMQWFTEHLKTGGYLLTGDLTRFAQMGATQQPGLAPSDYSKNPQVQARNPQAVANGQGGEEGFNQLGLQSVNVSPAAKGLFAAWRVSDKSDGQLDPTDVLRLDHSSLTPGSTFPTTRTQAKAALEELRAAGLCTSHTVNRVKGNQEEDVAYQLHANDRAKGLSKDIKQGPGLNDPDKALQTATSNIYYEWLNSALVQSGAGALHDHFCVQGLWVGNEANRVNLFKVYGDYNMLAEGGGEGAQYAAETAQLSQDNIAQVASGDRPVQQAEGKGVQEILDRLPSKVRVDFKPVDLASKTGFGGGKVLEGSQFRPPPGATLPLDQWHTALKNYMNGDYLKELFNTWASFNSKVARAVPTLTSFEKVSPHAGEEF